MRNHIAYVNRNNFVVDPDQTPYTYPYGANSFYFNPLAKERRQGFFGKLSIHNKRQLVHSKSIDYPETYAITDEIAKMAGDSVFYTDDELFDIVRRECRQKYNGERASLLGREQKLELARTLHFDYNAGNAKIARLLKLTTETLDEIFPLSRRPRP